MTAAVADADRIPLPAPITRERVVAVLRSPSPDRLLEVALALHAASVRCLEVTLTTPGALDVVSELARRMGDTAAIGVGTVLTTEDVRRAVAAGARYLLSPVVDAAVLRAAREAEVPFVAGAATPTEALTAWRLGASAVKVFPAAELGGPAFVRALRGPLPDIELLPTGGVDVADARAYLAAGAAAVGAGTPLTGDALTGGSLTALAQRAAAFLAAVRAED